MQHRFVQARQIPWGEPRLNDVYTLLRKTFMDAMSWDNNRVSLFLMGIFCPSPFIFILNRKKTSLLQVLRHLMKSKINNKNKINIHI